MVGVTGCCYQSCPREIPLDTLRQSNSLAAVRTSSRCPPAWLIALPTRSLSLQRIAPCVTTWIGNSRFALPSIALSPTSLHSPMPTLVHGNPVLIVAAADLAQRSMNGGTRLDVRRREKRVQPPRRIVKYRLPDGHGAEWDVKDDSIPGECSAGPPAAEHG